MAKDRRGGKREELIRGQRELARVHGVSQQAVGKWVADPRWADAGFSRGGPWTVVEVARQREWRRDVLRERTDAAAAGDEEESGGAGGKLNRALRIAQLKKLVTSEEGMRIDNQIKLQLYIKRSEAEEKQALKVRAVRTALMQLPRALRQVLADCMDPSKCEEILAEALRAVCVDGFGAEFSKE